MAKQRPGALHRRFLLKSGVVVLALAASASWGTVSAQTPAQTSAQAAQSGGTLNLLVNPEPTSLVALTSTSSGIVKVSPKVTEGLLVYGPDLTPAPQLATEWKIADDGLSYTFKLREGVRWHDGKPFTSADVARSIALIKQYHARGRSTFANVQSVETPDDLTVVFRLSQPAPYLLYALAASETPIVPAHIYDESDPAKNPNAQAPIGTGPFRFDSWQRGSHIRYVRNPDYWNKDQPYVDELIVRIIPDALSRAVALELGELDLAGENPVPLHDVERLAALPHLAVTTDGYTSTPYVLQVDFNLDNKYFSDLKVRQAVAHAIDRKQVVALATLGYGLPQDSPISVLDQRFHEPQAENLYPYDPAKAQALLDEAGYPRQADGYRFTVTHDYKTNRVEFQPTAEYLRHALDAIGIKVELRASDFAAFTKRIYTDRDFDFANTITANAFDPTVGVQRFFLSRAFEVGVAHSNASHYANPEVDRLLDAAAVEIDPVKRKAHFSDFQRIVAHDVPTLTLATIRNVTIANRRVHDHSVTADGLQAGLGNAYIRE